jgi:stage II sporulation protein D
MRRFLCLITLALAAPASASAGSAFFVDGHGWGHGIGMAQWGAYGYALHDDRSYDWILQHYYTDTTIGQTGVANVRVLLAEGRKSVEVGSAASFSLTDAKDKTIAFPAGTMTLGSGLRVKGHHLTAPITFTRGARVLKLGGRAYRGRLIAHVRDGRLTIVNRVGIDDYISGVVPNEMPVSWSMEALKAQAVAARSYAVATRKSSGIFDLYPDTRSQVYGGVASEQARSNTAITETAREVVKYNGSVATTFFHSTSGGKTASIEDVWSSGGVPYLVSVPDKYDSMSPHHNWGTFRYTAAGLKQELGSLAPSGTLHDATIVRNSSSRVDNVTLRGSGSTRNLSGPGFQSALGLRSTWFSIAVLSLTGGGKVQDGKRVLHGLARGVKEVWLEKRTAGQGWTRVRDLAPGDDGRFAVTVRPKVTTSFRLGSPKGKGVSVQVTVPS